MRIAAAALGIVGALCGIFFAQLVTSVGMTLAIVSSQRGELELSTEFWYGLAALLVYAFGVAGGVITLVRPLAGASLMLAAAVGGVVATIAINGTPSPTSGPTLVAEGFPYIGPAVLIIALALAALSARPAGPPASATISGTPVIVEQVTPGRAQLAAAVPMPLLAQPLATAAHTRDVAPGTELESFERHGEFVRVRVNGTDGYLPAWSVRRVDAV